MVYTPKRGAFAQTQYFDQQGTALPGMLANASDINLVDSGFVGKVTTSNIGLPAGIGVMKYNTVGVSNRPGLNYEVYNTPGYQTRPEDFAGIVVRNQFMRTNSDGEACYFFEDMCNVLSSRRVGGRIWVRLENGSTYPGSPVYWITKDVAGTGKLVGSFSGNQISSTVYPTSSRMVSGTVNLDVLQSLGICGLDFTSGGTVYKVSGLNFSGLTSMDDVVLEVQKGFSAAGVTVNPPAKYGNALYISSTASGAAAVMLPAKAPTTAGNADASDALGLTLASGCDIINGTAGTAFDTILLPNARFVDTFSAAVDGMALVELF